jgi:hypothetical protein
MIVALFSEQPSLQMVNAGLAGGVVEERQASVSAASFELLPAPEIPSDEVRRWLGIYRRHEEAMLRCIREPSLSTIADALWADPVVPKKAILPIAEMLWQAEDKDAHEITTTGH